MIGPEPSDKVYCLEKLLNGGIPLYDSEVFPFFFFFYGWV
jgi:hypothetical protein